VIDLWRCHSDCCAVGCNSRCLPFLLIGWLLWAQRGSIIEWCFSPISGGETHFFHLVHRLSSSNHNPSIHPSIHRTVRFAFSPLSCAQHQEAMFVGPAVSTLRKAIVPALRTRLVPTPATTVARTFATAGILRSSKKAVDTWPIPAGVKTFHGKSHFYPPPCPIFIGLSYIR